MKYVKDLGYDFIINKNRRFLGMKTGGYGKRIKIRIKA